MSFACEARGFGPLGEIDRDVGEDRVVAAGIAIDAHPRLEIFPAAEAAGRVQPRHSFAA